MHLARPSKTVVEKIVSLIESKELGYGESAQEGRSAKSRLMENGREGWNLAGQTISLGGVEHTQSVLVGIQTGENGCMGDGCHGRLGDGQIEADAFAGQ